MDNLMVTKRKTLYLWLGISVICVGIPTALFSESPLRVSQAASSTPTTASHGKFTVPLLPTAPPDLRTPTVTPAFLMTPPLTPPPVPTMDAIINPPVEKDLSPELPLADKAAVILQYPDGKRSQVLMAPEKIEAYLANFPPGALLVVIAPPAALMGHQPPTPDISQLPQENIVITAPVGAVATLEWPPTPIPYK